MSKIAKIVTLLSYLAGIAFGLAAILRFKQHKNIPTQITIILVATYLAIAFVGLVGLLKRVQLTMIPSQSHEYD